MIIWPSSDKSLYYSYSMYIKCMILKEKPELAFYGLFLNCANISEENCRERLFLGLKKNMTL